MPLITPPTYDANFGLARARSWAERRVLQIAGPTPTGYTLFKLNGQWYQQASPSNDLLLQADYVFLGGHVYEISDELRDEILAAGIPIIGQDDDELMLLEDGSGLLLAEDGSFFEMEDLT